jgi:hypothetical protein
MAWGITKPWALGMPGAMPLHGSEYTLVKDLTEFREQVKMPAVDYPAQL